mmetsp:Transcript_8082/g.20720  ORF Transcript_8082/g.20720 Transcript_8082/m.20720 type:complete len:265 (-) Transcript_8082:152-946(-)
MPTVPATASMRASRGPTGNSTLLRIPWTKHLMMEDAGLMSHSSRWFQQGSSFPEAREKTDLRTRMPRLTELSAALPCRPYDTCRVNSAETVAMTTMTFRPTRQLAMQSWSQVWPATSLGWWRKYIGSAQLSRAVHWPALASCESPRCALLKDSARPPPPRNRRHGVTRSLGDTEKATACNPRRLRQHATKPAHTRSSTASSRCRTPRSAASLSCASRPWFRSLYRSIVAALTAESPPSIVAGYSLHAPGRRPDQSVPVPSDGSG